jgi:uncharacterized lipoprotein NlpE involved in copper resistance
MKKSLLVTSLAALMALTLVGCNNSANSSSEVSSTDSTSASEDEAAPDVTLPDGKKCAYLVKVDFGTLTLPSYASIFMSGCMNQAKKDDKITSTWATGLDAMEMTAVADHAGWYVGYTADAWNEATYTAALATGVTGQPGEYGLVLGYNSTAAIGDASKGLLWKDDLKSTYCASFAYPANAKFTYDTGDNTKIVLHSDSFTKVPKKPEDPLTNYTIKVKFSKALPTWEIPHFFGSFNGWKTDYNTANELAARMTPNADRTIWSYKFDSIIPDTYEITMSLDYTLEARPSQSGFAWNKPDDWAAANLKYTINSSDGNSYTMEDADALTADLTKLGTLPDPTKVADVMFIVKNTGTALASTVKVNIIGSFTGWKAVETALDKDDTAKKTYTVTMKDVVEGTKLEFGVTDDANWTHKLYNDDGTEKGTNLSFALTAGNNLKVTISGDMSYFGTTETEHAGVAGTVVTAAWAA